MGDYFQNQGLKCTLPKEYNKHFDIIDIGSEGGCSKGGECFEARSFLTLPSLDRWTDFNKFCY